MEHAAILTAIMIVQQFCFNSVAYLGRYLLYATAVSGHL